MNPLCAVSFILALLSPSLAAADTAGASTSGLNLPIVIGFISFFVLVSIVITFWTSRSNTSTSDFYVAGKSVP